MLRLLLPLRAPMAAVLMCGALAACDSSSDDTFDASDYVGTYSGTATVTPATGSPTTAPVTITVATSSGGAISMTTRVGTDAPTTAIGTYTDAGASFVSAGTPGYNLGISSSGRISGSIRFDAATTATANGTIYSSRFDLTLTAPTGTLRYAATK